MKNERPAPRESLEDPPGEGEGEPTRRIATVTIDERARRSSPPPSVEVSPMVEVAASASQRRLISQAATRTYGVTGPPEELLEAAAAADVPSSEEPSPEEPSPEEPSPQEPGSPEEPPSPEDPRVALGPQELPRVRTGREEPEWSSKPTVMDLPRVGDFIPDDELISTRAPTPRLMPRAPEPWRVAARPSRLPSVLVALIALLALGVVLTAIVGLYR